MGMQKLIYSVILIATLGLGPYAQACEINFVKPTTDFRATSAQREIASLLAEIFADDLAQYLPSSQRNQFRNELVQQVELRFSQSRVDATCSKQAFCAGHPPTWDIPDQFPNP